MKTRLRISKNGAVLHEDVYEIVDAESFGEACVKGWDGVMARIFNKAPSIGALYETLEDDGSALDGVTIELARADR